MYRMPGGGGGGDVGTVSGRGGRGGNTTNNPRNPHDNHLPTHRTALSPRHFSPDRDTHPATAPAQARAGTAAENPPRRQASRAQR